MGYFFEFQRVEDKVEHKIGMRAVNALEQRQLLRNLYGDSNRKFVDDWFV